MSYNINQGNVEVRETREVVRSQVYSSNTGAPVGVNIEAGAVPAAQSVKTSQVQGQKVEDQEENDFYYTKERLNYIGWIKRVSYIAIVIAIAQIVLASVHVASHAFALMISLIVGGVIFLAGSGLYVYWSQKAAKTYGSTELFQPRATDNLTKVVFISGLLLSGVAVVGLVNLFMQRDYSLDFSEAQTTNKDSWNDHYEGRTEDNVNGFFKANFVVQGCFALFFFFYFLLASRAAFRCLKFDNQAMSYIVFLGNVLLLAFALGVIFFADHAFGYEEFPQIRAHFPIWNVRGLFYVAIFASVVSIFGFLVDHRSWRVGFFVLSFLLLVILVFLVNFTGYAYRHTRQTYEYYKGIHDDSRCINRLALFHEQELFDLGCPAKYVSVTEKECPVAARVNRWEPAAATPASTPAAPAGTPAVFAEFDDYLQDAADIAPVLISCLNTHCCGLMGQGYTESLLNLANFGLMATLAGCLVSIGCYYFWYVTWIDSARDKKKDFSWLGVMALIIIAFLVVFFTVDLPYPSEKLGSDGKHL